MIIQSLLIAALAVPAPAALTGPGENRRNLLNILPRKDAQGVPTVADPADKLASAQAALSGGNPGKAAALYRLFVKECENDASCDAYLDRAHLGFGQALAKLAAPDDKDASTAKESLSMLESVRSQALRDEAQSERHAMRVMLANNNLARARFDANNGAWNDAAARVENVGAEYPDVTADAEARKTLADIRDFGRTHSEGARMADLAEQLLAKKASPAPARTRAAVVAPKASEIPALRSMPGAAVQGSSAFDGAAKGKAPLSVSVRMLGASPDELSVDYGNWNVAIGQLGTSGRSPLLEASPYVNVRRVTRSSLDASIDRRIELQAGAVQVNSRFGNAQNSSADRLTGLGRRLGVPERVLGQIRSQMTEEDPVQSEVSVLAGTMLQFGRAMPIRVPFQSPVAANFAWSTTMMLKTAGYAPNAAANATAGLNLVFPKGYQIGAFAGMTEDVRPVSNSVLADLAHDLPVKAGLIMEASPQITFVAAGPIPGAPKVYVETGASMRSAATVNEMKLQTGVYSQVYGKPVQLIMSFNDTKGTSIEYGRRGIAAEASLTFAPGSAIYAVCEKEKIAFGGVDITNDGCLTGLRWTPRAGLTLTSDFLFGGKDVTADPASKQATALAATFAHLGAMGLDVADRIAAKQGPWEALNNAVNPIAKLPSNEAIVVLDAIAESRLPPQTKELIAGVLANAPTGPVPDSPEDLERRALIESRLGPIPDMQKAYAGQRTLATEAISLLSDSRFWDGAAAAAIDGQIAKAISGVSLSLGPIGTLRFTNAQNVLIGNAVNSLSSPFSPLTEKDATVLINRVVMENAAKQLGVPKGDSLAMVHAGINLFRDTLASNLETRVLAHSELFNDRVAIANRTLESLPPEAAARLRAQYGPDLGLTNLDRAQVEAFLRALPEQVAVEMRGQAGHAAKALNESIALFAHQIRLRANRMILQHMLAGEEFDRLTVDRGLKLGDHGVRMIGDSLKLLDQRQREALRARRKEAIPLMENKVDYHINALTSAAGDQLAADMEKRGDSSVKINFEEKNRGQLVGAYGEDALRAAIGRIPAQAKTKNISFAFDPAGEYSTVIAGKNGQTRVILPPPGRNADMMLDTAIMEALKIVNK